MRFLLRWVANAVAFYLALYLVDSLIAPRFYVEAVWLAVIVAVFLGLLNSLIRPLHLMKKKPWYALTVTVITVAVNALILQVFIWAGAPLSATHVLWVLLAGAFGNYIRPESAVRIGLLPKVPVERIRFVGNAALAGAQMALLSRNARDRAAKLARRIEYVEIAHEKQFQEVFAESMLF